MFENKASRGQETSTGSGISTVCMYSLRRLSLRYTTWEIVFPLIEHLTSLSVCMSVAVITGCILGATETNHFRVCCCLPNLCARLFFFFLFWFSLPNASKIHQCAITYMQAKAKSTQDTSVEVFTAHPDTNAF